MNDAFASHLEDSRVTGLFSEAAWGKTFVRIECALARAQADAGVIPAAAADRIAKAAEAFAPDWSRIADTTARDGFPIIGWLEQFRAQVGGDAAGWVHWGATTQDVIDTAMTLKLSEVFVLLEEQVARLSARLAKLADAHRATVMMGRTHLQPALPITFGLKAAGWLAPLIRHRRRLAELRPRVLVVQFGGAAGTLASLGEKADAVARRFAAELELAWPLMPWHAQRDTVLETASWFAGLAVTVEKFAQDVLLLAQHEIAEVRESGSAGGGSSAMPQKSNPIRSENILIGARSVATHHAGLLSLAPPEHERGTIRSQLELMHLPRMAVGLAGVLGNAERLAGGLVVDVARMKANVAATHGVMLAEACMLALSRHMKRDAAHALVREACAIAVAEQRHLLEILRGRPEAKAAVNEFPKEEADYLGSAGIFINRVLAEAAALPPPAETP